MLTYSTCFTLVVYGKKSSLTLHCTRCVTLKQVTSLQGPSPRHCAWAMQLETKDLQQRRGVGKPVSNLLEPRFEPQTSRSKGDCITA